MKINAITTRNTTFGYNEQFHEQVKERLTRQKDKKTAATLLELEKKSLEIEDEINRLEKTPNGVHQPSYQILTDCLVNFKTTLSSYLEKYFPKIEYNKNSIKEYTEELNYCKQAEEHYWRSELAEYLNAVPLIEDINESELEDKSCESETTKKTKAEQGNSATKEKSQSDISEILTQYIPTKSSPKNFNDVVGLEKTKSALQEEIIDYFEHPELVEMDKEEYGISPTSTILFYGPPGCGKTFITEALANQSGIDMYKMDVSKIGSKFVNQTATNIQKAFEYLGQITQETQKPVLLFMDEIDSLAIKRETASGGSSENLKTTSTLLKLIQEAKDKNIIIIAATNRRDIIDDALLDRFETETYFGLSDENGIKNLLKAKLNKLTKGETLAQNDDELDELAKELSGYSNRSIVHILEKAAKLARRNSRSEITSEIFKQAIAECGYEKTKEEHYKKNKDKKIGFIA